MYDISKLKIGDIFYYVDENFLIIENRIVDLNNNSILVYKKNLLDKYDCLKKDEIYLHEDFIEYCYKTKEEAEQVHSENIFKMKKELEDIKLLLNRLYIRAFDYDDIESILYKEAIHNYLCSRIS